MIKFVKNEEIYQQVLIEKVCSATKFLWLATADLKDLYIRQGQNFIPFLQILSELVENKISVRLIHTKEPGAVFREEFDRYPSLFLNLERLLCPRVHFKTIIIDGLFAYTGSANLTGAGLGARSNDKRNFEAGIITDDKMLIDQMILQYDEVWMGKYCRTCKRREMCPDKDQMII